MAIMKAMAMTMMMRTMSVMMFGEINYDYGGCDNDDNGNCGCVCVPS